MIKILKLGFVLSVLIPFLSAHAQPEKTTLYGLDEYGNLYDLSKVISGFQNFATLVRRKPQHVTSPNDPSFRAVAYLNNSFYLLRMVSSGNATSLVRYSFIAGDETTLGSTSVYSGFALAANASGELWASFSQSSNGSANAIGKLNTNTGAVISSSITNVSLAPGYPYTPNLNGLSFDSNGNLWGISDNFNASGSWFFTLNSSNGTASPTCNSSPCWYWTSSNIPTPPLAFTDLAINYNTGTKIVVFSDQNYSYLYSVGIPSKQTYQSVSLSQIGAINAAVNSSLGIDNRIIALTYGSPPPKHVWDPVFKYYYYDSAV